VYGDGSQTRTFCFVDDTVDSCVSAIFRDMYVNEIVNVGGEDEISILNLAQTVIRITKSRARIVHLPPLPEGDMTRRCPDVSKMKKLLDRKPIGLEEGIARLVAHYRATS
jgi:UDP-glucose 4-epimerase